MKSVWLSIKAWATENPKAVGFILFVLGMLAGAWVATHSPFAP